ncbi:MAG: hypothetical protein RL095_3668 [Verrucomicrobiota bacterium]|jgi:hypothetical protein
MNNRKITLLSLAVFVLCLLASVLLAPAPAAWNDIHPGMTKAEMLSRLGISDFEFGEKSIRVWHQGCHKLIVSVGHPPDDHLAEEQPHLVVTSVRKSRSLPLWFLKLTNQGPW